MDTQDNYKKYEDLVLEEIGGGKWKIVNAGEEPDGRCFLIPSELDGKKITEIGEGAFRDISGLEKIKIEEGIEVIGESAFEECWIEEIILPQSLRVIGGGAFKKCRELHEITLPQSLIEIGDSAFEECDKLRDLILPQSLIEIGERAFFESGIEYLTIPKGVKTIGEGAIGALHGLVIEDGSQVELCGQIDPDLEYLVIPASVKELDAIFYEKDSRKEKVLRIDEDGKVVRDAWGDEVVEYEYWVDYVMSSDDASDDLTIYAPAGSAAQAYAAKHKIKCVTEPVDAESLKPKRVLRFEDLESLDSYTTSYEIPKDVDRIDYGVFHNLKDLETITFEEGSVIKRIEGNPFRAAKELKKLVIPKSVEIIDQELLEEYAPIITFEPGSRLRRIEGSKTTDDRLKPLPDHAHRKKAPAFVVPENIEYLGRFAFYGWEYATVDFTKAVKLTEIPYDAFKHSSTENVILPDDGRITKIASGAFEHSYIKNIDLRYIKEIRFGAFRDCPGLTKVVLPSCESIGSYAFNGCKNLTEVVIPENCKVEKDAFTKECKVTRRKMTDADFVKTATGVPKGDFEQGCENTLGCFKVILELVPFIPKKKK